ncbi:conserved hypothetical protein [Paraburkholderia sacchari]
MEELAIHDIPESCVASREAGREALTGALTGQPLSHEMFRDPGADALLYAEGNTARRAIASAMRTRRGLRPWHVSTISTREPGDLPSDRLQQSGRAVRIGKARSRSRW